MFSQPLTSYIIFGIILIFIIILTVNYSRRGTLPLPPGPSGAILTGVKSLIPRTSPWVKYATWAIEYHSDIIHFRIHRNPYIVLSSPQAVHDLMNKRAGMYSDRPSHTFFFELCGRGKSIFNINAGSRHTRYRRLLSRGLNGSAYVGVLEEQSARLVENIRKRPKLYERFVRMNSSAVIMQVAYGYDIASADDRFIKVAEESAKISGLAMAPGRWAVDYYPLLRHLPSLMPFHRQAATWRKRLEELSDVPHNWAKKQILSGKYADSFTSQHLAPSVGSVTPENEDIIKWTAGGLYAGATDTTISALLSFILLMALYPTVQACAQAEIDGLGGEMPEVKDLERLEYLQAVLKEVLRYAPVANIALPHKVTQEDTYKGYRIPEGATIIANVWAIMHDPSIYSKPFQFDPSRFTKKVGDPDPRIWAFGFGRRTCPGSQFAETSLLVCMARILYAFDIRLPKHRPIPVVEFTSGFTSHVKPFDIDIGERRPSIM
ncbi:cytochrome p450 [Moniliophthora roreri MCA 2997]|uniref:Cytochrome p450 n=1 Tax=Moniliophthora roreri (strain MCA 2997) TaxID=1381753 RepID=V2WLD3_MONRO|nr:cytochrome p450 [Moniliophthora roreri MCA 2997]